MSGGRSKYIGANLEYMVQIWWQKEWSRVDTGQNQGVHENEKAG